jgi:hypothetical protein
MTEGTKWDAPTNNPNATWVKTRTLVGETLQIVKAKSATVKGRPAIVFELDDGRLFSASVSGTIGKQIARSGMPPTPGAYHIVKSPSTNSPTGYALVLRSGAASAPAEVTG